MFSLLLAVIYAAFISLGLPDALLGLGVADDVPGHECSGVLCGHCQHDYFLRHGHLQPDERPRRAQARHASRHGHQRRPDGAGTIRLFFGRRVLAALCLGGAVRARRGQCRCRSE